MDNNFTHILCVKVWSTHVKMTSNFGNILSIVKNKTKKVPKIKSAL